jgi:hypothetical protein
LDISPEVGLLNHMADLYKYHALTDCATGAPIWKIYV